MFRRRPLLTMYGPQTTESVGSWSRCRCLGTLRLDKRLSYLGESCGCLKALAGRGHQSMDLSGRRFQQEFRGQGGSDMALWYLIANCGSSAAAKETMFGVQVMACAGHGSWKMLLGPNGVLTTALFSRTGYGCSAARPVATTVGMVKSGQWRAYRSRIPVEMRWRSER